MAFSNGVEIKRTPKRPHPPGNVTAVRIGGEKQYAPIVHVSRETLNRAPKRDHAKPLETMMAVLKRIERRVRRRVRMRLRKRRGWR